MAYTKTQWKDQIVENPRTYSMRDNGDDTVTLLDAFGTVTELGTPVNAANMNHIEDGIAAVEALANTKSDDNSVVHKTGNETIAGDKTFQNNILYKKSTQDFTTTPAQPYYTEIRNVDINNFEIGQFRVWKDTDGANIIDLLGRYQNNSVDIYGATLGIKSYSNGRSFTYASTPTDTTQTNSTQIDTVGARNTQINAILAALYPVGSLYITTNNSTTCPLASLISGSSWSLVAADKALWTSNRNGNTTINAGLPNISGTFASGCMMNWQDSITSGAFYRATISQYPQSAGGTDGGVNAGIGFQASRSNSIYGASNTVQPPAYRVNVWRRTA